MIGGTMTYPDKVKNATTNASSIDLSGVPSGGGGKDLFSMLASKMMSYRPRRKREDPLEREAKLQSLKMGRMENDMAKVDLMNKQRTAVKNDPYWTHQQDLEIERVPRIQGLESARQRYSLKGLENPRWRPGPLGGF